MSVTQDQRQLARNRIETLVRATFAIQGYGEPDPKFVFSVVDKAESHLSQRQMHHPDGISLASIGDLAPIIAAVKPPPANIYGAGGPPSGNGSFAAEKAGLRGIDPASAALRGNGSLRSGGDSSEGGRNSAPSSRYGGDYQMLDLNSPQSLHQLTGIGWGTTAGSIPYARAGLNFGTVKDLRNYDKAFTGADVLKASSDVKQLGFDVNDKRAMRDHATIRHYDNDSDATNDAEKKFKHSVDNDQDMQELLRQRGLCRDPVKQKVLDAQIAEHTKHHLDESGLQKRIDNPKNHPKAKAAIKDDVDHIVHRLQEQHHRVDRNNGPSSAAKLDDKELKSEHPAAARNIAQVQDKNATNFKSQHVAALTKNDDFGETPDPVPKKPDSVKIAAKPSSGPKPA